VEELTVVDDDFTVVVELLVPELLEAAAAVVVELVEALVPEVVEAVVPVAPELDGLELETTDSAVR
jgi:hypothetical protein